MVDLKNLDHRLKQNNLKYRIISVIHLKELQKEIEALNKTGKINNSVYDKYDLSRFQFVPTKEDFNAQSIIIIAIPQKISIISFQVEDETIKTIIPPTYIYSEARNYCINLLSEIFGDDYQYNTAFLPVKLLAASSGLGRYGRNNLIYVDEMGSFARLEAFFIDRELDRDDWQKKEIHPQCENCYRCIMNCPTKCLKSDEFVFDAGKCLTFFNENDGDFPEKLKANVHNAIVGCMKCQIVCPANHAFLKEKESIESFIKKETHFILNNQPNASIELTIKLKKWDMDEYQNVLERNLKVLL